MSDTDHRPVSKFPLNGELDLAIRFKVDRSTVIQSIDQVVARCCQCSYVASSRQMILLSLTYNLQSAWLLGFYLRHLTNALAKDKRERSPTLKFEPSASTGVSRVKRLPVGVRTPLPGSLSEGFSLSRPIRCALRNASFRSTSSCSKNGSRFERIVPTHGSPISVDSTSTTNATYLGTAQVLEG
jgi:hypothetical protein